LENIQGVFVLPRPRIDFKFFWGRKLSTLKLSTGKVSQTKSLKLMQMILLKLSNPVKILFTVIIRIFSPHLLTFKRHIMPLYLSDVARLERLTTS